MTTQRPVIGVNENLNVKEKYEALSQLQPCCPSSSGAQTCILVILTHSLKTTFRYSDATVPCAASLRFNHPLNSQSFTSLLTILEQRDF